MYNKLTRRPWFVAGLEGAGKTIFTCLILHEAQRRGLNAAAFKPFDVNSMGRDATETLHDAEIYCQLMAHDPTSALVTPYMAHEQYPIQMAFKRDGIKINEQHLLKNLFVLDKNYDLTLIELPPWLLTPITETESVIDWVQRVDAPIIWIVNPQDRMFEANLSQIKHLMDLGFTPEVILNNPSPIKDPEIVFYVWQKLEEFLGAALAGMLPNERHIDRTLASNSDKLAANVGDLITTIFNSTKAN